MAQLENGQTFCISPPGKPFNPQELQKQFTGMSPRDVYTLFCKSMKCLPTKAVSQLLPDKAGAWGDVVTEIDLSGSYVGPRGVLPVIELCKLFTSLKSLNVANNYLTNTSIWHLCKMAAFHPTLTSIDISSNSVSWTAGMSVLELVMRNPSITQVNLQGTLFTPKVVEAIQTQIKRNATHGSRSTRRGPQPSNHATTIHQRSLKRFFRDLLEKDIQYKDMGKVPKKFLLEGIKERYLLEGRSHGEHLSPAHLDHILHRTTAEFVSWEAFMLIVMLDDVPYEEKAVKHLRGIFEKFDTDNEGYVGYDCLPEILAEVNHGYPAREADVAAKMNVFGADDSMTMNWDEFLLLLYDTSPSVGKQSGFATQTGLKPVPIIQHH